MTDVKEVMDTIVNADCMEFMRSLPDHSIDCVFTDVPYKQNYIGSGIAKVRPTYTEIGEYGANEDLDFTEFFELCLRKLKKGEVNFLTFCDSNTKYDFETLARKYKLPYSELVFCKTSPVPFCNNQWLHDKEYALHVYSGIPVRGCYDTKRSWSVVPNMREKDISHPTPKRVCECVRILANIAGGGQVVLDPFSGSGTTAVACRKLGLHYICVEKNEKYWRNSVARLEREESQLELFEM